ncbi:EAL domain-containing protein [Bacillus salitolerans]|uniref:EAL domain-containing protein n=1 Tax=Bacillus salitolerans TaxID=1437434 RepID=A0ABW4LMG6_9BACI
MPIKTKLTILFSTIVVTVLVVNNAMNYFKTKDLLIQTEEHKLKLISDYLAWQIEKAEKGTAYVEDLIGANLRSSSIAIEYALPNQAQHVTNTQLKELSKELGIDHITLYQENKSKSDIIGVKSSNPNEMNISTKEWGYTHVALQELLSNHRVSMKDKGQTLPHYWSGPTEISSSDPNHVDKWGYYFTGKTDYVINPYLRDESILYYEKEFGAQQLIQNVSNYADEILEITVINPSTFGEGEKIREINGNQIVRLSDEPILAGTYIFRTEQDIALVKQATIQKRTLTYMNNINNKNVYKYFFPAVIHDKPYVISISYDYDFISSKLDKQMSVYIWISLLAVVLVVTVIRLFAQKTLAPLDKILKGIRYIAAGHFGNKIDIRSKDELGALANEVNTMSKSLKSFTAEINESKKVIEFQAYHDPLTSLPNRRYMQTYLKDAIYEADLQKTSIAILFLDIDRFKTINDSKGHEFGDKIIKKIGHLLKESVGSKGFISRQGGDEFIVILPYKHLFGVHEIVDKILEGFRKPKIIDEQEYFVTTSIGISIYSEHSLDVDTLIKYADIAMYEAKDKGGNQAVIYNHTMSGSQEEFEIEMRLRESLKLGDIDVAFQPKYHLDEDRITGVEALVRWYDEKLGTVSPNSFIPIAEKTGLVNDVWEIVMAKSCEKVAEWRRKGHDVKVAVNFSAVQFAAPEKLVNRVKEILIEYSVPPELFEIEITESVLMASNTVNALRELKEYGITIAVDDFGTGYSSLSYLKNFPLNTLKIDRSFIEVIRENGENSEIAEAIIMLAKSLNLKVVAEGVEDVAHVDYLQAKKCEEIQGYWFSKPLPAEELEKLLNNHKSSLARFA